ncbi:MAG: YfcE family phosphodiesterase [bacterium]
MQLGIISDSHNSIPDKVFTCFENTDHILHAGDICTRGILTDLRALAPVTAALGNCDEYPLLSELRKIVITEFCGIKILLLHIFHPRHSVKNMMGTIRDNNINIVIFGHSHIPFNKRIEGILYFNPGSCSKPQGKCRTIGIIDIAGSDGIYSASGRIIDL